MIATAIAMFAVLAFVVTDCTEDVSINLVAPAMVDVFAWYVVGSYLGVF